MDREEAIKRIQQDLDANGKYLSKDYKEALNMAIETLSATNTEKLSSCGDLISRADAIEAIANQWLCEASAESPYVNDNDLDDYKKLAEELLADIPSADRPSGEWVERWERRGNKEVHVIGERECSVCKAKMLLTYPNYCPNCGAKMGVEHETD